jgi:hypothetical protein
LRVVTCPVLLCRLLHRLGVMSSQRHRAAVGASASSADSVSDKRRTARSVERTADTIMAFEGCAYCLKYEINS